MFPEEYTEFLDKRDAKYDGDPEGDYIVAEHVNKLQDAVVAIERALGKHPNKNQSLISRIQELEGIRPMRIPAFQWFSSALPADVTQAKQGIERYSGLILSQRSQTLSAVLEDYSYPVYGVVNAQLPLSSIQTEIGDWKLAGATGIFLTDFQAVYNRSLEQNILNSIAERNMNSLIQTTNAERLFSNAITSGYNNYGDSLNFPSGSGLFLQNFAYSGRQYTTSEIMAGQEPLIRLAKSKNLDIVIQGQSINQETYHYIQASGLIFSVDGFYDGPAGGTNWGSETPYYAWQAPLLAWQTNTPIIEQDSDGLSRQLKDGYIGINDDMSVTIKGHQIDSTLLDWVSSSVPGHVLKDASVHPSKLTTYDIQKIVDLLNNSNDDVQIDSTKINMAEGALPANIPAENMIVNVIEAINRKANPLSTNKSTISDAAIQSLDAAKLTGNIPRERFEHYVIAAINASDSLTNYIDVLRLDVDNINSTGVISANQIVADGINTRIINATESITSVDLVTSGYHTGHEGEYERLTVDWLTAYKLDGLKELHVETLTADNIGALVLEAIDAEITNGRFNNIVTQALTAETIKTDLVVALNSITQTQITNSALFGEAVIKDAAIENISVDKLKAGVINTSLINLSSPDGHLKIEDKTIRIYDDVDGSGNRRLRVVLGSTEEVAGGEGSYGLVVLGPDGTTRLYDHTGIYNAGLHDNVISEEKLQDDSISERVIRAGAIHTDHLDARIITSEKIAVDAILAEHIVASQITGAHIAGETITGSNILGGTITGGHIKAGSIDASHIQARSITSDKLTVGFTDNIIRAGYDSFEQEPIGISRFSPLSGSSKGEITRDWSWNGRNSFVLQGTSASNRVLLGLTTTDYTIPVMPGDEVFVSAYVRTQSTNQVPVTLGLAYNNGQRVYSSILSVSKNDRVKRLYARFIVPEGVLRMAIILGVETTNTAVYFDSLQVEEIEEGQTEPGFYKSTATTKIDGSNIETGYVGANHIHIGGGTVFGANNDIIDITDEGIKAKSPSGWAMLNSKGLEIYGGAFSLRGGVGSTSVTIDGQSGMIVENALNKIELNANTGFAIKNKASEQIIMDIDPNTGNLRFSGTARFYSANNPEMSWTLEESIENIVDEKFETDLDLSGFVDKISYEQDLNLIREQVDGAIMTWFGDVEPNLINFPANEWTTVSDKDTHLGDLYYDNVTGYAYRFAKEGTVYKWLMIQDTDITLALQSAQKAQDTADNKRRVFFNQPIPPYDINDLWTQGTSGDLMRAVISKAEGSLYHASDWTKAVRYTDDTVANEAKQAAIQAKSVADAAEIAAEAANSSVADIISDNKMTPDEKIILQREWLSILSEKDSYLYQAEKYSVNSASYLSAFNILNTYLPPFFVTISQTSTVNGETLRSNFQNYYAARQILLQEVVDVTSTKTNELEDRINQGPYADKDVQSGNEIYTDKADNSVVHVDIDGKSIYSQDSILNLSNLSSYVAYNTPPAYNSQANTISTNHTGDSNFLTISGGGYQSAIGKRCIVSGFMYINGVPVIKSKWANRKASSLNATNYEFFVDDSTGYFEIDEQFNTGTYFIHTRIDGIKANDIVTIKDFKMVPVEPSPDLPKLILSLNNFDIVSSVGRENLIKNSSNPIILSVKNTGEAVDNYNYWAFTPAHFIQPLQIGQSYVITGKIKKISGTYSGVTVYPFPNGKSGYPQLDSSGRFEYKFTVTDPTTINIFIYAGASGGTSGNSWEMTEYKLQKIDSAQKDSTPYSQSPSDIAYDTRTETIYKTELQLSEPLRSVDDVKDRLFRDSDGLWKVERNVGKLTLNGSNFKIYSSYAVSGLTKFYTTAVGNMSQNPYKDNSPLMTNQLKMLSVNQGYAGSEIGISTYTNRTALYGALPSNVVADTESAIVAWFNSNPLDVLFQKQDPLVETLPKELQNKLNNISSYKDSNYIYTIVDKTNILPEYVRNNLHPQLFGVFKSQTWYENFKRGSDLTKYVEAKDRERSIRLGMLSDYSSFTTQATGWLYFCNIKSSPSDFREEYIDQDGSIFDYSTYREVVVPKQGLDLRSVAAGTSGYLIFDSKDSLIWFISYQKVFTELANPVTGIIERIPSNEYWVKYNPGKAGHNTQIVLDDSIYIIGEVSF